MNVPVSIEDTLMKEAEQVAQERGISVGALMEEGLRRVVQDNRSPALDSDTMNRHFSQDGWRCLQDCVGQRD